MLVAASPHRDQQRLRIVASNGALYLRPFDGLCVERGGEMLREGGGTCRIKAVGGRAVGHLWSERIKRLGRRVPGAPWLAR